MGFYRGIKHYDYNLKKSSNKSNNNPYLYSRELKHCTIKLTDGFLGLFLYINPFMCFITIPKEIYRLEVNIRKLEDEKKTDYYNNLF